MTSKETKVIEKIRNEYKESVRTEPTRVEKIKELDKKVKKPVKIFSYTFGTVGALVLGTGMTMAMSLIPGGMIAGIAIGCAGIAASGANYPLHNKLLDKRKKRYSKEILELTGEALNEK